VNVALKSSLLTLLAVAILGAIAAPKILPLLTRPPAAKSDGSHGATTEKQKKDTNAPLRVSAVILKPQPFAETVESTGTLRAEEGVELQAEINGKVVLIDFTEGARVKKGALLVKLNDSDLKATRDRAVYRKELAELQERRFSRLLKQGVARQEEYDTALNALNVQHAEIDLIDAQMAKTEIRAPFDGVVGLRYVSEGAFVNAATRVATLQRLEKLKIDFSVPERYASRLRLGSPVVFTVVGASQSFAGRIYAFDPRIDAATRTVLLRAVCPNDEGRLLPGAFAKVRLTLSQLNAALLVPSEAVVPGLNEKDVFIIKNGVAARRPVETGTRTEALVHVLSGLAAGDVVITSGLQQMRDGLAVIADGLPQPASANAVESQLSADAAVTRLMAHDLR
jgi:membrane fusion protein (multidrug efflux system)